MTAADAERVTGWTLKPEGMCRAELCVPMPASAVRGSEVDVAAFWTKLGGPVVASEVRDVWALGAPAEERNAALEGLQAPDFTLPDMNGKMVSLKDFRGKVVFLNFWATWCKPCEEEMPSMRALYEGLKGQPFEIVAVNLDKDSPPVAAFAKKYRINFIVLRDAGGKIKELYKTTGVPETFIIDQNGVIAEKVWGPRDWTRMDSLGMIFDLIKNGPKQKGAYVADKSAERK